MRLGLALVKSRVLFFLCFCLLQFGIVLSPGPAFWGAFNLWAADYTFLDSVDKVHYPEEHVVLAREVERITYQADGSHIDEDEVYLTILDQQGKTGQRVQSFYLNKHYSDFSLDLIEIIKGSGGVSGSGRRVVPVDLSKNSREDAPTSSTEMNIYDSEQKVLKVFIPDLSPGDTIHYRSRRRTFKPVILGQIYGLVPVQHEFPVLSYRLELVLPKDKKLHYLLKDQVPGTVKFRQEVLADHLHLIWDFSQVPKIVPEPHMVSFVKVAMRLLFSSLDSWEEVSRWYFDLAEPKLAPTPAIKAQVRDLVTRVQKEGTARAEDKIAALFYFVAQQIRYMGITAESNRPGFEPHAVGLTFDRRYGVCRDKAALLVSMLRVAGFKAAPVLLSMGRKLDPEVVVPYFNHAIVAVLDDLGHPYLFLDPTSETSKQLLPDFDRDCSYLVAAPKGGALGLTPVLAPDKNLMLIQVKDRLDKDGRLAGELRVRCKGFVDTVFRSILLQKSKDEQRRFLSRFLLGKRQDMEIMDLTWSDPGRRSEFFHFGCNFLVPKAIMDWPGKVCSGPDRVTQAGLSLKVTDVKTAFWPVSATPYLGLLERWILGRASLSERQYPLRFGYVFASKWVENLELPRQWSGLELPTMSNQENGIYSSWTSFALFGKHLKITRYFALKELDVSAQDYPWVTKLQHDLAYEALLPILFVKGGEVQ